MIAYYDCNLETPAETFVQMFLDHYAELARGKQQRKTSYLNSAQRYLSEFKSSLKGKAPPDYLSKLKLSANDTSKLLKEKQERLHTTTKSVVEINGDQLIRDCWQYLNSPNKYVQLLAVAVLTGRRCSEILVSATFTNAQDRHTNPDYWCRIHGLLKKRGKECQPLEVPFLAPVKLVLTTVTELRKKFPCSDQKEANRKYAKSISNNVKKFAPEIGKLHRCRNVYAALCFVYFNEKKHSIARIASDFLGHEAVSSTVLTYLSSITKNTGALVF